MNWPQAVFGSVLVLSIAAVIMTAIVVGTRRR